MIFRHEHRRGLVERTVGWVDRYLSHRAGAGEPRQPLESSTRGLSARETGTGTRPARAWPQSKGLRRAGSQSPFPSAAWWGRGGRHNPRICIRSWGPPPRWIAGPGR